MTAPELGFIGVGRMGNPMLARLLDAGYSVHVYDPSDQAMAIAKQRGAKPAESPAAVASAADIVLVSLPTPDVVRQVVLDQTQGIVRGTRARLVIDLSTTGPRMAGAVAAALAAEGRIALVA